MDEAYERKEGTSVGLRNFEGGVGYSAGTFSSVHDKSGHRGFVNLFRKTYIDLDQLGVKGNEGKCKVWCQR